MRILVISDTHIPIAAQQLPPIIIEEAKKSDYCLHAGDFISQEAFEALAHLVKVYAVHGNMDNLEISKKFPEKTIIELGGVSLGLIHGRGAPSSLLDYVKKEFLADLNKLDIIIFGHTHYPCDKIIGGKAYFNPGSPTDTTYAPYRSYGIMEIEGKIIKKRILKIE